MRLTRKARALLVFGGAALLAACSPDTLDIIGRTQGATGSAVFTRTGDRTGDLTLRLGGKTYTGHWVYRRGVDPVTFNTAAHDQDGAVEPAMAVRLHWHGNNESVLLTASDGDTLRCLADFSQIARNGTGMCQDSSGEIYDILVY